MSRPIIEISNLSKKYRLGAIGATTLRDSVQNLFGRKTGEEPTPVQSGEFWALRDVSFSVQPGTVAGVIGRNGAGKSTLLKILSRITEPTRGRAILRGRVASLLEVGTGFHPDLTGRENVFLNGAILGMRQAEIAARFDEIVAFAEVEKFIDTPVKHYSSGMRMRLAFAVAAHLEPEVIIIDEVLAVGDTVFQKKCLDRMRLMASSGGRTVLYVSHQLDTVREICQTGILLENGSVTMVDSAAAVVDHYIKSEKSTRPEITAATRTYLAEVRLDSADPFVWFGNPLAIAVRLQRLPVGNVGLNIVIKNQFHRQISLFSTEPHDGFSLPGNAECAVRFLIDFCPYAPGSYTVDIEITEPGIRQIEIVQEALRFDVLPRKIGGTWAYDEKYGIVFPPHRWEAM